jgi:LytS/YehU family sensor histidine kinase
MEERFSGRVTVAWEIEPAARSVIVPALLLQPLLENAFRHGVEAVTGPQTIVITARIVLERAQLHIAIRSSGGALKPDWQDGVGLQNCRRRLGVHYGDAASLSLSAGCQGGVTAALSLPLHREPRR